MIPYYILAIEDETDRAYMTALFFQYQKLMYSTISNSLVSLLHFYSFFVLWNKGVCKLFMCVISSFLLSVLESIV